MAAVLYSRNGTKIGEGMNKMKSHPLAKKFSKHEEAIFLHAEIAAIADALRQRYPSNLEGSTLYVARVLANGTPAMAKPCAGCQKAIIEFGIGDVVWTT